MMTIEATSSTRPTVEVLLSISTLAGLGLYAIIGASWLDPVAALIIAVFAIHEGREAWKGELVEGDDDDD